MIISRARGYVFVHIPKTAGTAMALALEARAARDDILIGDTPKAIKRRHRIEALAPKGRLRKHALLADALGILSIAEIDAMLCFTLVRNPWDRMVSYYHWLRLQSFAHPAVDLAQARDFSGFLNDPATQASLAAMPYTRALAIEKRQAARALYIRIEHLAQDMQPLCDHLGFVPLLPRANISRRADGWQEHFSAADRDLVGRLAAADIARFGYDFES